MARRGRRRRGGAGGGRQRRRRRRLPATSALGECGRGRAHAAPGDARLSAGPGKGCSACILHPPSGGAARRSCPRFAIPRDALHPSWGWAGRDSLPVVTTGEVGLVMLCLAVAGGDELPPRAVRERMLRLGGALFHPVAAWRGSVSQGCAEHPCFPWIESESGDVILTFGIFCP